MEYAGSASNGGLSNSSGTAIEPSIVATGSGATSTEYVAWADNRSGVYEIYVARYANGSWQELADSAEGEGISNTLIDSRRPSVTLDSSGNPVVAWTEINGTSTDIFAAKYDPTANAGAGGWVALGSSLSADGLSNTGHADSAQIVNTAAGLVVAWLDTTSGHANVFVRQFNGTNWVALGSGSDSGTGVSGSSTSIPGFSLATSGANTAIAWTQPGTSAGNSIYLKQYNGSTWSRGGFIRFRDRNQRIILLQHAECRVPEKLDLRRMGGDHWRDKQYRGGDQHRLDLDAGRASTHRPAPEPIRSARRGVAPDSHRPMAAALTWSGSRIDSPARPIRLSRSTRSD